MYQHAKAPDHRPVSDKKLKKGKKNFIRHGSVLVQ